MLAICVTVLAGCTAPQTPPVPEAPPPVDLSRLTPTEKQKILDDPKVPLAEKARIAGALKSTPPKP